jgi:epoxyqueuosine reductase
MRAYKSDFTKALKAEAKRLGFVACGITSAGADFGDGLNAWLESGAHGEMAWMEARAHQRAGPKALWPDAQSVIMLAMSYAPATDPLALAAEPNRGRISVYAQGADYHDVIKKALKALARWIVSETSAGVKLFVDTAPVMEKPLGAQAGIGWQGKHSNLVNRDHGSWLFLGSIFTTLALEADAPHGDQCGSCTACQSACPTDAFPAPYRLDARRCISYLTIEHKGPIPNEFRRAIGNRIYGCDDCLAVCPWNKFASAAQANIAFAPKAGMDGPELSTLLALDDAAFRALFAKTPIKRIGRDRMVRNTCIAAGNSSDKSLLAPLQRLANDPSGTIREAAAWAISELAAGK